MSALPDMYTRSPRAASLRTEGGHIRQSTNSIITLLCNTFTPKIKGTCNATNLMYHSTQCIISIIHCDRVHYNYNALHIFGYDVSMHDDFTKNIDSQ